MNTLDIGEIKENVEIQELLTPDGVCEENTKNYHSVQTTNTSHNPKVLVDPFIAYTIPCLFIRLFHS